MFAGTVPIPSFDAPIIKHGMTDITIFLSPPGKVLPNDKYEVCVYSGNKPQYIHEKSKRRLLCKVAVDETAPIAETGMACFFILLKNNEAIYMGKVGTTGCPFIASTIKLIKDDTITLRRVEGEN